MGVIDSSGGELVLVRLWRWDADKLESAARLDFERRRESGVVVPGFTVSVFGMPLHGRDQSLEDLAEQICRVIPMTSRWYTYSTRSRLAAEGFGVRLSEPPHHHYDIVLGAELRRDRVETLAALFDETGRRRNPKCRK